MARFANAFNTLVQDNFAASGALASADTALANAMDGFGDLAEALNRADAAIALAEAELATLSARGAAIPIPSFESPRFSGVVTSAQDVIAQISPGLTTDIEVLRQRMALARSEIPPDVDTIIALDAAWARNAGRQVETENIMLDVAIATMSPTHPQHGLSRAYLASNNAVLPLVLMLNLPGGPLPEDARDSGKAMRAHVAEMDNAIADSRKALARWRLRSLINADFRALVPLYAVSHQTEAEIANILLNLADLLDDAADGIYDPRPFTALDSELQALIQRRANEAQARLTTIADLSQDR